MTEERSQGGSERGRGVNYSRILITTLIDSLVVLCNMFCVKMHFNLSFG